MTVFPCSEGKLLLLTMDASGIHGFYAFVGAFKAEEWPTPAWHWHYSSVAYVYHTDGWPTARLYSGWVQVYMSQCGLDTDDYVSTEEFSNGDVLGALHETSYELALAGRSPYVENAEDDSSTDRARASSDSEGAGSYYGASPGDSSS